MRLPARSTVGLLGAIKHTDRKRMANFAGAFMRKTGPLFKEHRLGRDNLRAAFPEKSDAEIEKILGGVWDNLGRIAIEFAHLDEFSVEGFGAPTPDVITYPPESKERYDRIMKSGTATIGFAAHLANWELPGVGAKLIGAKSAVLYPAAEYRRRQRRHHQAARTADGRTDPDRPRRAVETWRGCCNPASTSACSPISITARASR